MKFNAKLHEEIMKINKTTTQPHKDNNMNDTYKQVKSFANTRTLDYKYLSPTNHKGARIKIIDKWFKKSVTIPFSYEYSTAYENALAYLINKRWSVSGMNTESEVIYMSRWDSDKQLK